VTVISIPAGVLLPAEILKWLARQRQGAEDRWQKAGDDEDFEQAAYEGGACDALTAVIGAISSGIYP
jgi:hypothetical protein